MLAGKYRTDRWNYTRRSRGNTTDHIGPLAWITLGVNTAYSWLSSDKMSETTAAGNGTRTMELHLRVCVSVSVFTPASGSVYWQTGEASRFAHELSTQGGAAEKRSHLSKKFLVKMSRSHSFTNEKSLSISIGK